MPDALDPRLARVVRELDQAAKALDDVHAVVVQEVDKVARALDDVHAVLLEVLRDNGITWYELGESYDPPKSRQAVSKWLATRRRRWGKQQAGA